MKARTNLRTVDVPQADSLPLVRRLVEAIEEGNRTNPDLASRTGFSERHVRYRLEAARILGLADEEYRLTLGGRRLLATRPGSEEERAELRHAVKASKVAKAVRLDPSSSRPLDMGRISKKIMSLTGLSLATAERRARTLRSWSRQVVGNRE